MAKPEGLRPGLPKDISTNIKQSIALVTGASSEIGEATGERLASAGYAAGWVDAGIRKLLQLDAPTASLPRTPVLQK